MTMIYVFSKVESFHSVCLLLTAVLVLSRNTKAQRTACKYYEISVNVRKLDKNPYPCELVYFDERMSTTPLYDGILTEDQLLDSMLLLNEYTTFWDGRFSDMSVFDQSEVEHLLEEVAEIVVCALFSLLLTIRFSSEISEPSRASNFPLICPWSAWPRSTCGAWSLFHLRTSLFEI